MIDTNFSQSQQIVDYGCDNSLYDKWVQHDGRHQALAISVFQWQVGHQICG